MMNRVLVLGCCGAGKSTLAKHLHQNTGLPAIHLDQYYWKPGWKATSEEEWNARVKSLAEGDRWIIDGNYVSSLQPRLDRADTIVYLQYSTFRCLYRVIKRIVSYRGTVRPDMPEGCDERFDLEFLHYVLMFNYLRGNALARRVQSLCAYKRVHILKNDREVKDWLAGARKDA